MSTLFDFIYSVFYNFEDEHPVFLKETFLPSVNANFQALGSVLSIDYYNLFLLLLGFAFVFFVIKFIFDVFERLIQHASV